MENLSTEEILSLVNLTLIGAGEINSIEEISTLKAAVGAEHESAFISEGGTEKAPTLKAAGLAIVAKDTGRVLMLQRSLSEDDPAAGRWEFPGGTIDEGETPDEAAIREWSEETGIDTLPVGYFGGSWISPNGIYQGFVYRINKEADLEINLDHEDRGILNPDDPDGDNIEVIAWWDINALPGNPALREELKDMDWNVIREGRYSENILSLTLIEAEDIHYHYDPETQFYNQCHSDEDGKFCSGDTVSGRTDIRDSDGKPSPVEGPVKRGKLGASLVDPHEGTKEFDGLKGYNKTTGKPVPGSDAYLEAHGIPRELWDSRPYVKFEADKKDAALHEAFERGTPGAKQWDRLAAQEGQEGGYIMYKHQIPDSPYGPIAPQVRPTEGAITNYADRKKTEVRLANAKQRYIDLKTKVTPEQLITEQKARVKKSELNLERMKKATPEIIRAEAAKGVEDATKAYAKAKDTKDPDIILSARKNLNAANREVVKADYQAGKFKAESALYHAEKEVFSAKQRLDDIQEDPKAFLAAEIIRQGGKDGKGGRIKRAENAYKGTKAKYLFTKDSETARIDVNPDKQNIKNLVDGKGRIYFAMEGSIKNDAVLAAVRREDPTAAVVNVPSVTLWHNKSANEGEIQWFARTHGKNRQIILIPDADGVNNVNVMRQATALASALKTGGAKQVLVAAPPVKHGTKFVIDPVKLPSTDSKGHAVFDERKGIDDHLGAGRGTLGQLAYQTDAKIPKFSLAEYTRGEGNIEAKKLNKNALPNHEKMLGAISSLAGKNGAVQVSKNLLMQTSGITSPGSAIAARDKLHDLGIIDVKYVFDKDVLKNSRKRVLVMPQKEVDSWVARKIIKPLPDDLFAKDDYEASPIIIIKDRKYIVKDENSEVGVLSDLPDWKPPKSYDGWRSPLTGKRDTTGIANRMVSEEAKTKAKKIADAKVAAAKTAEQRLKAKKAPPGRKIVRTPAGAKKYNVPIGSLVPLSVDAGILGSMVLLSSVLSEGDLVEFYNSCRGTETIDSKDTVEFYNSCHGEDDGRFCEGKDGPGRTRDNGTTVSGRFGFGKSKVRTVAETHFGSVEVDGIKAKAVYEATSNNGDIVRLYDKTGKADRYKDDLLNNHVRMHDLYPLQPPRNIVVVDPDKKNSPVDNKSFAAVYGNSPNTYVNAEYLGINVDKFKDGFQMPSAKKGNTKNMDYLLTHEYGHHVDFERHSNNGSHYDRHPLYSNSSFKSYLSRYGKSDARGVEGYAESFAEWNHSGGKTKNPAAIAMARYEGWADPAELRASAQVDVSSQNLDSSLVEPYNGDIVRLTHQNLFKFAKDKVEYFPEDTEDDIYADIPEVKGIRVVDTLTEEGPELRMTIKTVEPSQKELDKADRIMAEVLKELGVEGS